MLNPASACDAAIRNGLRGISITDHVDYDYPGHEDEFLIDYDLYLSEMEALKHLYKNRLDIRKGIEIGLQPHVLEKTSTDIKNNGFDYVIASLHIVGRQDPYMGGYYEGRTKNTAYSLYLNELFDLIKNFDDFDVLGHIDYIARYSCYDDRTLYYADFPDVIDSILKTIIYTGKGIEVNTRSYRKDDSSFKYDINLLKRYRELGGEIVNLGSDAHKAEHIGFRFDYFKSLLIQSGFKYTACYSMRKPEFMSVDFL